MRTPRARYAGGIEAQTRKALENMHLVLVAAGAAVPNFAIPSDLTDVVKCNVMLTSMKVAPLPALSPEYEDFGTVDAVWQEYFGGHQPARTCIHAKRLPADALIEVDVTAIVAPKGEAEPTVDVPLSDVVQAQKVSVVAANRAGPRPCPPTPPHRVLLHNVRAPDPIARLPIAYSSPLPFPRSPALAALAAKLPKDSSVPAGISVSPADLAPAKEAEDPAQDSRAGQQAPASQDPKKMQETPKVDSGELPANQHEVLFGKPLNDILEQAILIFALFLACSFLVNK
eukprot:gene3990-732_t